MTTCPLHICPTDSEGWERKPNDKRRTFRFVAFGLTCGALILTRKLVIWIYLETPFVPCRSYSVFSCFLQIQTHPHTFPVNKSLKTENNKENSWYILVKLIINLQNWYEHRTMGTHKLSLIQSPKFTTKYIQTEVQNRGTFQSGGRCYLSAHAVRTPDQVNVSMLHSDLQQNKLLLTFDHWKY